ncbi:winged helix-turn-helix transcriptional regulator [Mangrovicoccus algicola]|uniref:Helix-turn-helix transcriptional regulator n=1 Tax=Mangrovicoccus algicola TaxID=2771008 RepID=A0A8J6YW33_9RHOB|nr:helix-turn-helix domain-containing protein [Mangrovicoccus algicola]MBE3640278.1 helix-turn-helix transcriptional regulator [Mangrovicoccus algicola]
MDGTCHIRFSADCACRTLFDEIADKWSMMILTVLESAPHRFNELKRCLEGVSQKSLTQALRRLERNGLVAREVLDTSPVTVRYSLTPLGLSLLPPFKALYRWTWDSLPEVEAARIAYDGRLQRA